MLAKDPDSATTKALADAAGDKNWVVQAAALEALAERGDPSVLARVKRYMSDEKDAVRYTAAAAVLRLSAIKESGAPVKQKKKKKKVDTEEEEILGLKLKDDPAGSILRRDTLGVSGVLMIEAIIVGEGDPERLADLARQRLRETIRHCDWLLPVRSEIIIAFFRKSYGA